MMPFLMMDVKVSRDKYISKWVDLSMVDEVASKLCTKKRNMIDRVKRSKTLSEVKLVENISKNPRSFLVISPVQMEVLPSRKVQRLTYGELTYIRINVW